MEYDDSWAEVRVEAIVVPASVRARNRVGSNLGVLGGLQGLRRLAGFRQGADHQKAHESFPTDPVPTEAREEDRIGWAGTEVVFLVAVLRIP